jgi:serine/threonine protein kinase
MARETRKEGEVLDGRYRLVQRLGRGGFGDVWRAEELLPDGSTLREVALKLLHGPVAQGPDWSAEARIIASLRHPGLVTVYAAGVLEADRPIPFVAMELLIGDNLGDVVAGDDDRAPTVVPWRRVLAWAREAAAALDVIHRAGVVHLDLKPANLFLAHGAVKVLDFGIARQGMERAPDVAPAPPEAPAPADDELATAAFLVQREEQTTESDDATRPGTTSRAVVGTPGFMAPEIFEEGEASPATDAYALAACMVQLTTGRLPQAVAGKPPTVDPSTTVGAWFAEVQSATVRGHIRDLGREHPELPAALVELLERWLALDPHVRGVETGGLRAALDAVWSCPYGATGNPYRGLRPYTREDEGKLFARESDVSRLGRELVDHPGVVLYGQGAVGLSSLAVAGIVPDVARRFADDKHDWEHVEIAFSDDGSPDEVLSRSLQAFLSERDVNDAEGDPIDALQVYAASASTGVVVLLEDVERVAKSAGGGELERFLTRVSEGMNGVRVVATIHAHDLEIVSGHEGIGDLIQPWLRFIGPIQPAAVSELVLGPAALHEIEIDDADAIIEDLRSELDEDGTRLPLVSLALEDWWSDGELSAASWRQGGGVVGRLRAHAEEVFESLDPQERTVADAVLLRLVSVDGTSLSASVDALLEASEQPRRLARVVERLWQARLLARDGSELRLSHIGLAESWSRLHDLRLHDIDRLTFLEELRNAARRWALGGKLRKHLWPPDMLRQLARRRDRVVGELDDTERDFLAASQRQRRIGWLLRAFAALTLLFCIGLANYVQNRIAARERAQKDRLEQAQKAAALERMVTASRRTRDPYLRVALLSGAITGGSQDPLLAVDLLEAGRDLPPAQFLSLTKVDRPTFPWGSRWLVGQTSQRLVLFDFSPPGGEEWVPLHYRFRPHANRLTDVVPFAFDTALATRDQTGELKVWRLREDGQITLAALAPDRCTLGPLRVAEHAPVLACTTPQGVGRWDLRHADALEGSGFDGRVLDVSDDGSWIIAAQQRRLLLWNATAGTKKEIMLDEPPKLGALSPHDPLLAVVHGSFGRDGTGIRLDILALEDGSRLLRREVLVPEPVTARWADSGLDVAICDYEGAGEWHYLRNGARAPEDPPPPDTAHPCERRTHRWPKRLRDVHAYGRTALTHLGPRVYEGGWKREDGTLLTHDLVSFDPTSTALDGKLRVSAVPDGEAKASASAAAVFRDGDRVVWQVGDHIRVHDDSGKETARWRGHLLARCPTGRLLAWRRAGHADDAEAWEIFAARVGVVLAQVPRRPGNVIGADPECHRVLFQWLDGEIAALSLDQPGELEPLHPPGGGFVLDGYVYDTRPSPKRGEGDEAVVAGLWLAMSSGALARVRGKDGAVRAYGHATPRATAMADGPSPGDLLFADDRGVILRRGDGSADRIVLPAKRERMWEDIALGPEGRTLWLSSAHGVTVVDYTQGEVIGDLVVEAHDRFARWDEEGSLLLWPFSFKGQPKGQVIPIGRTLATAIGTATSNIRVRLQDNRRAVIHLDE